MLPNRAVTETKCPAASVGEVARTIGLTRHLQPVDRLTRASRQIVRSGRTIGRSLVHTHGPLGFLSLHSIGRPREKKCRNGCYIVRSISIT
jgi:hypothetical protein